VERASLPALLDKLADTVQVQLCTGESFLAEDKPQGGRGVLALFSRLQREAGHLCHLLHPILMGSKNWQILTAGRMNRMGPFSPSASCESCQKLPLRT
jgi:hypothetical protein